MAKEFSYIDEDGYTAAFEVDSGRGVLTCRSDSGTEVAVYLSADAAQQLSSTLAYWAGG